MTRSEMLKTLIENSGLKHKAMMKVLGIKAYSTFRTRLSDPTSFSAKEINILVDLLNLSEEDRNRIFFINYVA